MAKKSTYYAIPSDRQNVRRREIILTLLRENPRSAEEILHYFSENGIEISIPSLKKDIGELRKNGYDIQSRKGVFSLSDTLSGSEYVSPDFNASIGTAGQFLLLKELQNKPLKFCDISFFGLSEYHMRRNVLNALLHDGLVSEEKGRLYANRAPYRILDLPDAETLFYLLSNRIKLPGKLFDATIRRLASEQYIDTKKNKSILYDLPNYIRILKRLDYTKKPIAFQFKGSKGNIQSVDFFLTGAVAYSAAKDEIYLLGRTAPKKAVYKMVRADSILWDTVSESPQITNYNKDVKRDPSYLEKIRSDFERMKQEMFVISPDKPENVEVLVEYSEERMDLFSGLIQKRGSTASLEILENGDFIYRDTIRGMSDFAKFLRGFGSSVTVLGSPRLRKQMKTTAENVLKNYGEI